MLGFGRGGGWPGAPGRRSTLPFLLNVPAPRIIIEKNQRLTLVLAKGTFFCYPHKLPRGCTDVPIPEGALVATESSADTGFATGAPLPELANWISARV